MCEGDIIEVHDSQPTVTVSAVELSAPPLHPSGAAGPAAAVAARKSGEGAKGGGGGGGWIGSTKLGRLELELREMRRKRPGAKAVVFSQVRWCIKVAWWLG